MAKEYIEREAIYKNLFPYGMPNDGNYGINAKAVLYAIDKALIADVVEVTYCKDCSHCDPENKHCDHPMGTSLPMPRKDNDFCSYGERKDK